MQGKLKLSSIVKTFGVLLVAGAVSSIAVGDEADKATFTMGALGDSITRGFDAGGILDTPRNSWSTGFGLECRIRSHYHRLEEALGQRVDAYNVAKSGATTADLPRQADLLAERRPDYATILIGANDVCSWPSAHGEMLKAFKENVRSALTTLVASNPAVKVLVVPVPDMYNLWQVGKANGCQAKWEFFNICLNLLGSDRTEADRTEFVKRLKDANAALEGVAAEFSGNVLFAESVENATFEWKHISKIDCFHPSVTGQNYLSLLTWRDGWFASMLPDESIESTDVGEE